MEVSNRYVTIKTHIHGAPEESNFEVQAETVALTIQPGSNDIIVRNVYVSVDPYQINRLKSYSSSQKALAISSGINPGEGIVSPGLGKVVASSDPEFEKDDLVTGFVTWAEYSTVKAGSVRKLDPMGFPLSYHLGILGFSGMAAYAGFFELCKPRKGEKVFVSSACGSIGSLVGQYAKLHGCYVVGCAGSSGKVALLKEKLGFDDAFNYKEETDYKLALKRYFPGGIDIYFDNVGAEMLEAAVANMNHFGRIAVCGTISEYTDDGRRAAPSMLDVIYKRIKIQGFLATDHLNLHSEFRSTTCDYLRNEKIKVLEDISDGLDSIPSAFVGLFRGDNIGKRIVKIAEE
ncbi:hypothetical protein Tsubulata_813868 [Turnera subulata]|uniref:Enoyl reductase (ER) domain-containing protein n=1 Tax=Turnera subulata TaxID=218843 RepID=A0A9Q0JDK5_9ROSI|nr:hypothetical protein Tsubulata_813868 [Turnera subulata]